MNITLTEEGYYLATGEGELRPILAEGGTEGEARANFYQAACDQYAEAASLEHFSFWRQNHAPTQDLG